LALPFFVAICAKRWVSSGKKKRLMSLLLQS